MKTLLIAGLILLVSVKAGGADPSPFERMKGLGKDREKLTEDLIHTRAAAMMKASEFWLLRMAEAKIAPERIFDPVLWGIIENEAAAHKVDPYVLAGLVFVESFGKPDVQSPTGPRGILQFTSAKAKDMDMKITYGVEKRRVGTKYRGKGKKRRAIPIYRNVRYIAHDERLDVGRAMCAGARSLAASYIRYGRWDYVVQEHHNGIGRLLKGIALWLGLKPSEVTSKNVGGLIAANDLSYARIFFDNTPYHRTALYQYLELIKKEADYAPTYSFRVLHAAALMKIYQENPDSYKALFEGYRSRFKENGFSPSRMWYFYEPEVFKELQFQNLVAIQEAKKAGRLVPLPEPWTSYGYNVRLHGPSAIGEKDLANQKEYIQAEPGTVGALIAIMHEVKLLQETSFKPYETNSLVRTLVTHGEILDDPGSQASAALPIHTIGKAIDFPIRGMETRRLNDLLFILSDMDSYGMISYVLEHRTDVTRKCNRRGRNCKTTTRRVLATIHVVPHPQWEAYFNVVYRQATGQMDITTTSTQ